MKLFFLNVMGMMDENEIKKVKYEINRVKNVTVKKTQLWGWGSNKMGQLAQMDYSNSFIKVPTLINLPEMKNEQDYISKIYTGKSFALLQTKFGELYMTGNYTSKEKIQVKEPNNNLNQPPVNKKNRIKSNTPVIVNPILSRWVNVTKSMLFDWSESQNESQFLRVKDIHLQFINNTSKLLVFGYKSRDVPFTLQDKKPKFKHFKKGDKFPTSDSLIEGILQKKKSTDKFLIVYEDKLLKFLETTLTEFQMSEVPYHKVIQIKYFGSVIWDRKMRYYKYDYD